MPASLFQPSRRGLLGGAFGAAALTALAGAARAEAVLKTWPLGVQLFTVNKELDADLPGTLRALKAAGYQTVETAGFHGLTAQAFRGRVEDAGLVCRGAHVSLPDLMDDLDGHIADALALGVTWLVCSSPKPPQPLAAGVDWVAGMIAAMTPDAWKFNAEQLARMAPKVKQAGLRFGYHNHPMEFRDWGGTCGYDILLAATAPDELRLEMDLGWVAVAGRDPAATMKAYASRIDLLHVKDMIHDPAMPVGYRSVEVGQGIIDWPAVFAEARAIPIKGFFIEQEPPFRRPVLDSLRMSQAYLAGF